MNPEPNALEGTNEDQKDAVLTNGKDELSLLKDRARMMNITFSNNIKLEALKEKIAGVLEGNKPKKNEDEEAGFSKAELRNKIHNEAMKLVRIRITNMNPNKKELFGEFFTVANKYIGTVTKFIPYTEATHNGYHVPNCIYEALKEKEYLQVRTRKNPRTGAAVPETKYVREFAIEVLEPLTEEELKDLAIAQAAAGSIEAPNT